jgi:hypothetical protein
MALLQLKVSVVEARPESVPSVTATTCRGAYPGVIETQTG